MFGGVAFLLNGNMCVGVWKDSLIVRLHAEDAEKALREEHVGAFDITGRPMKGWLLIASAGLEDDDQLQAWIARAVKHVAKLPAK
jgi:TfoX/Sxy family transcriptional regulator of competence genes